MADYEEENDNYEQQKKKSGKRKIEIKPITNKPSKQVTFSKRRPGLFKKASELCSLCGAEVAVITFSGAGKLYSFGHPSADDVVYRYINLSDYQNNNPINNFVNIGKISAQYKQVLSSINLEKKKVTEVVVGSSSSNGSSPCGNSTINCNNEKLGFWWDLPIHENMGLNELEELKIALEGLRVEVTTEIDEINRNCSSSLTTVFAAGNNNTSIDFGSSDGGNSNVVAVDSGFEDSDNWGIPSLDPIMLNSLLGHNNACGNFEIFQ